MPNVTVIGPPKLMRATNRGPGIAVNSNFGEANELGPYAGRSSDVETGYVFRRGVPTEVPAEHLGTVEDILTNANIVYTVG